MAGDDDVILRLRASDSIDHAQTVVLVAQQTRLSNGIETESKRERKNVLLLVRTCEQSVQWFLFLSIEQSALDICRVVISRRDEVSLKRLLKTSSHRVSLPMSHWEGMETRDGQCSGRSASFPGQLHHMPKGPLLPTQEHFEDIPTRTRQCSGKTLVLLSRTTTRRQTLDSL